MPTQITVTDISSQGIRYLAHQIFPSFGLLDFLKPWHKPFINCAGGITLVIITRISLTEIITAGIPIKLELWNSELQKKVW